MTDHEDLISVSTELLRLYKLRFYIAAMEADRDKFLDVGGKAWREADRRIRPLLRQYGKDKAAAWKLLEEVLSRPVFHPPDV